MLGQKGRQPQKGQASKRSPSLQVFHLHLNRLLLHRLEVGPHIIKRYRLFVFDDGGCLSKVGPFPACRFLSGAEANLSHLIIEEG